MAAVNRLYPPLLAIVLTIGCSSSPMVASPPEVPRTSLERQRPAAPPAPPPLSRKTHCRKLTNDGYRLLSEHLSCNEDADCSITAPGCMKGYACGRAVRADAVQRVDPAIAELSLRFKAECGECQREGMRCATPNPVCRDGLCTHEPVQATCDQLQAEAAALVDPYDACASDADCVFAQDGGCPDAFACGSVVNARQRAAFSQAAVALSRAYFEHCGRCARDVAMCSVSTPICSDGRCSRRRGR